MMSWTSSRARMPPSRLKRCASAAGKARYWKRFFRIRFCNWSKAGGSFGYDISHLRPDWDAVIQTCEVRSVTHDGELIYAISFTLYLAGSAVPADFSNYSKAGEQRLWSAIVRHQAGFFAEVQPGADEHFIKAPYQVETRLALYKLHLDLQDYDVV